MPAIEWMQKGPFGLMNDMGMEAAAQRVRLAVDAGYFKMPEKFGSSDMTPWAL